MEGRRVEGAREGARAPRRRRRATRAADGGGDAGTGGGASGTSVDDTDAGWSEAAGGAAEARDEARLRADRPPHHDQGW